MTARYGEQVLGSALLVPVVRWGNDRTLPGETVLERDEEPLHRLPAADRELFGYVMARPDKPGWELFERYVLPGWRAHDEAVAAELETDFLLPPWPEHRAPAYLGHHLLVTTRQDALVGWCDQLALEYKVRATADAITGPAAAPRTPLLVGTTAAERCGTSAGPSRSRTATAALADVLTLAAGEHPWAGRTFTAGWGSRDVLDVTLGQPDVVVEVSVPRKR
ncbi:hypothetical protein [Streptomyces sp. NPDC018947]|uniref:hypothetical protein n=1 Tax=Streptomyces sp. NPDC018947 TaxID=3365054 RepID=UPI003794E009